MCLSRLCVTALRKYGGSWQNVNGGEKLTPKMRLSKCGEIQTCEQEELAYAMGSEHIREDCRRVFSHAGICMSRLKNDGKLWKDEIKGVVGRGAQSTGLFPVSRLPWRQARRQPRRQPVWWCHLVRCTAWWSIKSIPSMVGLSKDSLPIFPLLRPVSFFRLLPVRKKKRAKWSKNECFFRPFSLIYRLDKSRRSYALWAPFLRTLNTNDRGFFITI